MKKFKNKSKFAKVLEVRRSVSPKELLEKYAPIKVSLSGYFEAKFPRRNIKRAHHTHDEFKSHYCHPLRKGNN